MGRPPPRPVSDLTILRTMAACAVAFVIFGCAVSPPQEILAGLVAILTARDALITDYIYASGRDADVAERDREVAALGTDES